ncbi:MAG: hypothetical protein KME64_35325 [Scytonematopsis contorta HA4267-MV1]|jgi:hypothetical protein|nr:hypothetical protein [Scytonematopsis contorta HA4267-MV1]
MAQLEIADVVEQIREEIEVDTQGRGKASIRATGRLAGVSDMALRKAFNSANLEPSELAKKLIQQGFTCANLNNWSTAGIPDIAIAIILEYYGLDAGKNCTEQAKLAYKAFATIGIRSWMQRIKGWEQQEQQPQPQLPIPSLEEISTLLDLTLGKAGLEPKLVAGAKLNAIGKRYPHLLKETEDAKSMLVVPVENKLLTPKQLGEILAERTNETWSSQRINKLLIEQGFQVRNRDGNPDYLPTEKGKTCSQLTLNTAKGRDKTVQHLRWLEVVLETIETAS